VHWDEAQDVVRLTFKAFHDALHAQGDAIRWLESALDGKADNEDMWLALQDKASHSELSSRVHELSSSLACKAEKGDAQPASSTEQRFSSLEHSISALQRDLSSERSSRQSHSHELSDELASLRSLARENSHAVTSLREHVRSSGCSPSDSLRDHLQHYIDDVKVRLLFRLCGTAPFRSLMCAARRCICTARS
jgi:chromosome segregation ATPase